MCCLLVKSSRAVDATVQTAEKCRLAAAASFTAREIMKTK
jgi:hypothetical protein